MLEPCKQNILDLSSLGQKLLQVVQNPTLVRPGHILDIPAFNQDSEHSELRPRANILSY